jgi:hypothetical protein
MMIRTKLLWILIFFATPALANTYYIAANGSDSNNGTAKATPWVHAPGMNGCSANCASNSPVPGDRFVLRGGDTWHRYSSGGTGGTPIGLSWSWNWAGASTHCNYDAGDVSTCIYIGADKTWFSGSSWKRPILSEDNAFSKSLVGSCAHNQTSNTMSVSANYIIVDNLEFSGMCVANASSGGAHIVRNGTYITVANSYFHGWTEVNCSGCDDQTLVMLSGATQSVNSATHNIIAYDVMDGSDSYCTGGNACSGWPVNSDAYEVEYSVFRYNAQPFNSIYNFYSYHDNLFEFLYQSYDSTASHSGVIETGGAGFTAPDYLYNNVIRNTESGVTIWPEPMSTLYVFNNVFYGIGNSANCFLLDNSGSTGTQTDYFFNNTLDAPCPFPAYYGSHPANVYNGSSIYNNNHYIGYTNGDFTSTYNMRGSVTTNITNNGGHVYQSESAANGQGFTTGNNYAPTSSAAATVGVGNNMTGFCKALPDALAAAACQHGSTGAVSYDATTHSVVVPGAPAARPSSGAWDVGAHQFNSSSSSQPNPPTGLTALAQ